MTSPVTNTGKQTPSDTIRTIMEALEECRVCIEYYHAGVPQKLQARIAAARAIELLSTLEASLKAEEQPVRLGADYTEACTFLVKARGVARKAIGCLYIAVDESIAEDVREKVEAAFAAYGKYARVMRQKVEQPDRLTQTEFLELMRRAGYDANEAHGEAYRDFSWSIFHALLSPIKRESDNAEPLPPAGGVVERLLAQEAHCLSLISGYAPGSMAALSLSGHIETAMHRVLKAAMKDYGSGAVQSAEETHGVGPSDLAVYNPSQQGDACIAESAPATFEGYCQHCGEKGGYFADSAKLYEHEAHCAPATIQNLNASETPVQKSGEIEHHAREVCHGTHGDSCEMRVNDSECRSGLTAGTCPEEVASQCFPASSNLASLSPAPVSLEKGVSAIDAVSKEDGFSRTIVYDAGVFAKACAEAWGLKYVD